MLTVCTVCCYVAAHYTLQLVCTHFRKYYKWPQLTLLFDVTWLILLLSAKCSRKCCRNFALLRVKYWFLKANLSEKYLRHIK